MEENETRVGVVGTLSAPHGVTDPELRRAVADVAETVEKMVSITTRRSAEIGADRHLSAIGRREAIRKEVADTDKALTDTLPRVSYGADIKRFETEVATLREGLTMTNRLRDSVPAADRPIAELRTQWLWNRLLALPDVERLSIAMSAAADNDCELLRAISSAPKAFAILPAAQLADVDRRHVQLHHSKELARIGELEATLNTIAYNFDAGRKAVARHAPDYEG